MYKKLLSCILLLLLPLTVFAVSFENVLKDAVQIKRGSNPRAQTKPVRVRSTLEFSDFRIEKSGDKQYWFVKLKNRSDNEIRKRELEIKAIQYDSHQGQQSAGDVILNSTTIRSDGTVQLQREFRPVDGIEKIRIDVRGRSSNRRLLTKTFPVDMRTIKPVTTLAPATPLFVGKMSARILADEENYLWYVEVKNIGNGSLDFKDYDFRITPSIRGVQQGSEPFTDVTTFYDQSLKPGESFRIYVATAYDSCFSGDLINARITHMKSAKVIDLYQPIERPLYQVNSNLFSEGQLRYWDFTVEMPLNNGGLPPYYNSGFLYGHVKAKDKKRGRHDFTFNHHSPSAWIDLPPELTFSDGLEYFDVDVKWFASFCGRNVLIREKRKGFEKESLRDMEKPATINVK